MISGNIASFESIQRHRIDYPLDSNATGVNVQVVATITPINNRWRTRTLRADASYSVSTALGLLTIKSGTTVIAQKFIIGAGALDFDLWGGRPADNRGDTMSATLDAGGAGITGTVYIQGFQVYESA